MAKVEREDLLAIAGKTKELSDTRLLLEQEHRFAMRDTLIGALRKRIADNPVYITTAEELAMVRELCKALGVPTASVDRAYGTGPLAPRLRSYY